MYHWDQHTKEPHHIEEQHQSFDPWQLAPQPSIDEQTKTKDSPEQHGPMPLLYNVAWVVQYKETLGYGSANEAIVCDEGLPCNNAEPAGKITKELPAPRRRKNRHPIKRATSERDPEECSAIITSQIAYESKSSAQKRPLGRLRMPYAIPSA